MKENFFDTTKQDGTLRKLMDVSIIRQLGWSGNINLVNGVCNSIREFE
jgi:GDP-L-fucose synthase